MHGISVGEKKKNVVHISVITYVRRIRLEKGVVFFRNILYKETFTKEQSTVIKETVYTTHEKLRVTKFATYRQMITRLCNCCLANNIFGNILYKETFTKEQSTVIKETVYMTHEKLRVTKFATYRQMITLLCNCCLAKNILVSVHVNLQQNQMMPALVTYCIRFNARIR